MHLSKIALAGACHLEKQAGIVALKEASGLDKSAYQTPEWLEQADDWVNNLRPEKFIRKQLGFKNYRTPEFLANAGEWFKGLSPEMKAGLGIGVPLAALVGKNLLFGK